MSPVNAFGKVNYTAKRVLLYPTHPIRIRFGLGLESRLGSGLRLGLRLGLGLRIRVRE